ncbi:MULTISPECIES: hypothetical protein [unclassified Sphingomonas]|uniref:hypothetical protein n=1 Tax=unclassified Sphingomonas TaxID=196159 RepID=UPI002269807A|nr:MULTISPECIES: hypothetical protein [unclassified Sphingomonas]
MINPLDHDDVPPSHFSERFMAALGRLAHQTECDCAGGSTPSLSTASENMTTSGLTFNGGKRLAAAPCVFRPTAQAIVWIIPPSIVIAALLVTAPNGLAAARYGGGYLAGSIGLPSS